MPLTGACPVRECLSLSSCDRLRYTPEMESKLAKEAERSLIEATQRLSPEERLNAYLEHCRLMMELYEAGQQMRSQSSPVRTPAK
jgi:hypothetical protein